MNHPAASLSDPHSARNRAGGRAQMRLGSLRFLVRYDQERYARMLASVFGVPLLTENAASLPSPDAEITIAEVGPQRPADTAPADRLLVSRGPSGYLLETDPLRGRLDTESRPWRIEIAVSQPELREDWLSFHFWILFNRLLLLLDRMVLHAAAIRFNGTVVLFSGPKGAGKTTLSLALVRAGGVLLAEDHVLVTRNGSEFLVSGCNNRMRVTAKTEKHFLEGRLPPQTVDAGGEPKKEFQAGAFLASRPYEDFRPDRLFFNRIGSRFHARPLPAKAALLRLMQNGREMQRFAQPADYRDYLGFLAEFAASLPAFDLEVNNRLEDLDQLAHYLRETS